MLARLQRRRSACAPVAAASVLGAEVVDFFGASNQVSVQVLCCRDLCKFAIADDWLARLKRPSRFAHLIDHHASLKCLFVGCRLDRAVCIFG